MDPKLHAMHQRRTSEATVEGVARLEAKLDELTQAHMDAAFKAAMAPTLAKLDRILAHLGLSDEPDAPATPEAPAADDDHASAKHRRHAR